MIVGKKYRIIYQVPGFHRVPRKGVVKLISLEKDRKGQTVYIFSGRPIFGTTEIQAAHVSEKVEVPEDTRCYIDRKV